MVAKSEVEEAEGWVKLMFSPYSLDYKGISCTKISNVFLNQRE